MEFINVPEKDFQIQTAPVTQTEWEVIMGENPSQFKGDEAFPRGDHPVEQVSYVDIKKFIEKINERDECTYRLPTAEEWELCCQGEKGRWLRENSNLETKPVKSQEPNSFGLYDMTGNVWEITEKSFGRLALRGGSWSCSELDFVPDREVPIESSDKGNNIGFRLVREVEDPSIWTRVARFFGF